MTTGEAAEPTARDLILVAGDLFTARVHAVPQDRWDAATPCTDWTVRDLVNHVVGEHLWAPHLLGGESVADVGDQYEGDVVGASPVAAWDAAWDASRLSWQHLTDDSMPVHLSRGPTPVGVYADEMLLDLVVHGWDLSRGAGLDESGDPQSVARALDTARQRIDEFAGSGLFGDRIDVDSADPLQQLLGLVGRQP